MGTLCLNAQANYPYTGGTSNLSGTYGYRTNYTSGTCPLYYDSTLIFYRGGNYGGTGSKPIDGLTCPAYIDSATIFYRGGNFGGTTSNSAIAPSICQAVIDSTVVFYHGGNYGGNVSNNAIAPSICQLTYDSTVIFYHGGNFGGNISNGIASSTCAIPDPTNIYMGGLSSTNAPGNVVGSTANNTAGSFITSIDNQTITNGNCLTLTTTGLNATGYTWLPITGLNNPNIASPIASPNVTTTYTVTATGTTGCRSVFSVVVTVVDGNSTSTSFRYPSALINRAIITPQSVIFTGITGGTFSASSTNLKINTVTGEITPNTSTVGTYTVTYSYGVCNNTVNTSVTITNDASDHGELNYVNFYTGGTSLNMISKALNSNSTCQVAYDYTLLIYAGGVSSSAAPKVSVTGGVCAPAIDYSVSFYTGGASPSTNTVVSKLNQNTCAPYIEPSNTIYAGGASASSIAKGSYIQNACTAPLSDNFYMGGSSSTNAVAVLTNTSGASTGTIVNTVADFTICPGVSTTLTTTGATSYVWTPAAGLSSTTVASPIATPLSTTTYTVVGSGGVGCFNTAKVTVTVLTDGLTSVSYGAYRFNETDMSVKKVNYIYGPLSGTFSTSPSTGLFMDNITGSFTPGLSVSGLYTINYNYTKAGCNYTYPVNINVTKLPPAVTYPNPSNFYLNYSNISVTPTVTDATPIGFELLNALPNGLTMNTTTGVISGTPSALVTNAQVGVRAYNYTKAMTNNYGDTYTMTINVYKPIINSTTVALNGMDAVYGTASASQTFNVSGQYIVENILVTPPAGFEVSRDASTYANTVTLTQSGGTITNTDVYIRLKTTAKVGSYSGSIVLSSLAADNKNIPIATSNVSAAPLTVTATYFQKFYGSTLILGAGSGNFSSTGLLNSETIGSVTLTPSGGATADEPPGFYGITPSAATGGTFSPTNYVITYVPGQFEVLYSLYNFDLNGNTSNWVKGKVPIPKIAAGYISNITNSTATYDGTISSAFSKLTQKGVCWSTNFNPTVNDGLSFDGSAGTGPMTAYITGLTGGLTYYARTFIKVGNYVYYGPNVKFITPY
jgi:hypothetical protein